MPRRTLLVVAIAAATLLLDQWTKRVVLNTLAPGESWPPASEPAILGTFRFTRVANDGVAFGLFQGRGDLFVVVALVVVAGLLVYQHRLPAQDRLVRLALALQVGGALGNLVDRLRFGHVVDFLHFHFWPVFNVADSAISVGVVLLAWQLWRQDGAPADDEPAPVPRTWQPLLETDERVD
jgi:signal peptidase II